MASRGRHKPVGVVEMARDLGVSTATVSRALNDASWVRRTLNSEARVSCPPLATAFCTASWNSSAST